MRHNYCLLIIHVELLADAHLNCGFIEYAENFLKLRRRTLQKAFICKECHNITGDYCLVNVPHVMDSSEHSSYLDFVHDIVKNQCKIVKEHQHCNRDNCIIKYIAEKIARHQCKYRPE